MNSVDEYFTSLDPNHAELIKKLRSILLSIPKLKEEYKWNRPVYSIGNTMVAYLLATKQGVDLGFDEGAQINDPRGLIEGTGKNMRHAKLSTVESTDFDYLRGLLEQAVRLAQR